MDALGVIAIGVGGLEAETVMLGHPSMMRLPDIVGVKLTGQRKPGITATDIVLALTEFLRKERVVGAYVEFFGEGADSLSIGDRATISNMCPEYGATAAMFYIDQQTIDYLKLTGREPEQVALVENYAKLTGLWADAAENRRNTSACWSLICPPWCAIWRPVQPAQTPADFGPASNAALPTKPKLAAARAEEARACCRMARWCRHHQLHQHTPTRATVAAGCWPKMPTLGLVRKPWVKTSFAPGSPKSPSCIWKKPACCRTGKTRLWHRRLRLHHL